jgi:hypothetical protein
LPNGLPSGDVSHPIGFVHLGSSGVGASAVHRIPEWLKLHLDRERAEAYLAPLPPGAFLVRQSRSELDTLVLSAKTPDSAIFHGLVLRHANGAREHGDCRPATVALAVNVGLVLWRAAGHVQLGAKAKIAFKTMMDLVRYHCNIPFHWTGLGQPCYLYLPLHEDGPHGRRMAAGTATHNRAAGDAIAGGGGELNAEGDAEVAAHRRRSRSNSLQRPRSQSESQLAALEERCSTVSAAGPLSLAVEAVGSPPPTLARSASMEDLEYPPDASAGEVRYRHPRPASLWTRGRRWFWRADEEGAGAREDAGEEPTMVFSPDLLERNSIHLSQSEDERYLAALDQAIWASQQDMQRGGLALGHSSSAGSLEVRDSPTPESGHDAEAWQPTPPPRIVFPRSVVLSPSSSTGETRPPWGGGEAPAMPWPTAVPRAGKLPDGVLRLPPTNPFHREGAAQSSDV